ncbi:anti-sigma factor [Pseudoalteromonas sp.]|uniref:anti-sigma factor family protein n=1 Tax=Pseudoalteromonas sp. TaxID=53249 RepID=UPI003566905F
MKISDETLSAFLDSELLETEMEQVRLALETDDDLVMRLAELSEVDSLVKAHAYSIDESPYSAALSQTMAKLETNNVVQLSAWQRLKHSTNKGLAIAASIAIVFGIATTSYLQTQYQGNANLVANNIATALDTQLSSDAITQADGSVFKANLSFANNNDQLCRQYEMSNNQHTQVAIACKTAQGWQVKAQLQQSNSSNGSQYQTASKHAALDDMIDQMINGQPLNRNQEQHAIAQQWHFENN